MHSRRLLSLYPCFWLRWSRTSSRCLSKLPKWKYENELFDRTKEDFASRCCQPRKPDSPRYLVVHKLTQCENHWWKPLSSDDPNWITSSSNGWLADGHESVSSILELGRSKSSDVASYSFVKSESTNGLDGPGRNETRNESSSSWNSPIRSYSHLVKQSHDPGSHVKSRLTLGFITTLVKSDGLRWESTTAITAVNSDAKPCLPLISAFEPVKRSQT